MLVIKNRVGAFTDSTGTGDIVFSSNAAGCQPFSVVGDGNDVYYTITDQSANWESGVGTYTASTNSLSRNIVISSSNSNQKVSWASGTKQVFSTISSDNVPSLFAGDAGTNLNIYNYWTNGTIFKSVQSYVRGKALSGRAFSNDVTLTFSVSGLPDSYHGGVLAPDGSVVLIPYNAPFGYIIPRNMEVVTASPLTFPLPSTTLQACCGGILSRQGWIHFVPFGLAVGVRLQMVINNAAPSSAFIASYTFPSVGGTSTEKFSGAALLGREATVAFVPYSAARGAYISAETETAVTVTTYALAYTTTAAYRGGVTDAEGNVHFVPHSAARGQKVSKAFGSAPVASTYSLPYTESFAYWGGCLDLDGNIHFAPFSANRGMKVTSAGVATTYELVYTGVSAYIGAVLAPTGEIHFIPNRSPVGQKIAVDGTVSTYPLVFTTGNKARGGVLLPDGGILCVPTSTQIAQIIYTLPAADYGYGARVHPLLGARSY